MNMNMRIKILRDAVRIGAMILLLVVLGWIAACQMNDPSSQEYDLVILNGRVMDPETNFDALRNIGIKDGKIVTITGNESIGSQC